MAGGACIGQHDVASGGAPPVGVSGPGPLPGRGDRRHALWERQVHACVGCLVRKGLLKVDEMRRCIEQLDAAMYEAASYYEKWAAAITTVVLERQVFSNAELLEELGDPEGAASADFATGDVVRVRDASLATRWRRPHLRTPGLVGHFANPERLAFGGACASKQALYLVRFDWRSVCDFDIGEGANDTVTVEIYHGWLQPATEAELEGQRSSQAPRASRVPPCVAGGGVAAESCAGPDCKRRRTSGEHAHEERKVVEQRAVDAELPQPAIARALVALLQRKGTVTAVELRAALDKTDAADLDRGEAGRRVVARAWTDVAFRERLLRDGNAACEELGMQASNATAPTRLVVVEQTPQAHHLIVCTLCSCYPLALLGLSPDWYKSREYRSRAIREPRSVLKEFGIDLPGTKRVEVHDSTADCRYLVLPERPSGTEGWPEERLQNLVTRDSMIGVATIKPPL